MDALHVWPQRFSQSLAVPPEWAELLPDDVLRVVPVSMALRSPKDALKFKVVFRPERTLQVRGAFGCNRRFVL